MRAAFSDQQGGGGGDMGQVTRQIARGCVHGWPAGIGSRVGGPFAGPLVETNGRSRRLIPIPDPPPDPRLFQPSVPRGRSRAAPANPWSALAAGATFQPPPRAPGTLVLGAGKASPRPWRQALERLARGRAAGGLVVTRYHRAAAPGRSAQRIEVHEAAHPVCPTPQAARAQSVRWRWRQPPVREDLVLCLMSGGASALLTPAGGRRFHLATSRPEARPCWPAARPSTR